MRAGFKQAWNEQDYRLIIKVAERRPQAVLQEDAGLLMYYDNAMMRAEDEPAQERLLYWSLAKIGYVVFGLSSCPPKLAFWDDSSHWQPQEAGFWGTVSHKNRFARVQYYINACLLAACRRNRFLLRNVPLCPIFWPEYGDSVPL